jgi:hypothetical protein
VQLHVYHLVADLVASIAQAASCAHHHTTASPVLLAGDRSCQYLVCAEHFAAFGSTYYRFPTQHFGKSMYNRSQRDIAVLYTTATRSVQFSGARVQQLPDTSCPSPPRLFHLVQHRMTSFDDRLFQS